MSPEPVTVTVAAPDPVGGRPADAWSNLDMTEIVTELKATGVSAPADQVPALTALVKDAKADGHDLYLVVVDQAYSPFTVYRDIAHEIQTTTGGTVLVFGPTGLGTSSTDFSRVKIEDATSEAHKGVSIPQQAREIYDKATEPNVDWTLVTILLIVVVVIGAVAARLVSRRRADAPGTPPPGDTAPHGESTPDGEPTPHGAPRSGAGSDRD